MKQPPMNFEQVAYKEWVRSQTKRLYKKTGKCKRCGREGYTEFDHYEYTPSTFRELCAICHRNDTKKQYKSEVFEWMKNYLKKKNL